MASATVVVDAIPWEAIKGVEWKAGGLGSSGVYIVCTSSHATVVKPSTAETCAAMGADLLARALGVKSPHMRMLDVGEESRARHAMRRAPYTNKADVFWLMNTRIQALSVMDFVAGTPLYLSPLALKGPQAGAFLQKLGGIVAVDMLTNNFDRVPLCWNNSGNFENVLVQEEDGELIPVAIDSAIVPITNPAGLLAYQGKVRAALLEAFENNAQGPMIRNVQAKVVELSGVDMGEEGCQALQQGIVQMCRRLACDYEKNPRFLLDLLLTAETAIEVQKNFPFFHEGLKRLQPDFLTAMLHLIIECAAPFR